MTHLGAPKCSWRWGSNPLSPCMAVPACYLGWLSSPASKAPHCTLTMATLLMGFIADADWCNEQAHNTYSLCHSHLLTLLQHPALQDSAIPLCGLQPQNCSLVRKVHVVRNRARKASWDLLVKLKGKKEMPRQWKKGHVSWEEYGDVAWLCRVGVRKVKAQLELNLARDTKKNKHF